MIRYIKLVAVLGILGFAAAGPGIYGAAGGDVNMKKLMGNNFSHLQKILVDLIRSDYATVAHDVQVIGDHAGKLSAAVPPGARKHRELFLSMAFNLKVHADNLRMIAELLKEHDREAAPDKLLKVDYLRNSAAAHFGQMVTTCVACHNQFRRRVLK